MKTCNFKHIKAWILFLLFPSFIAVACARPEPKSTKEVSITLSEIHQTVGLEVGDILEVILPGTSLTGYTWETGFCNQSVLKPYGKPQFFITGTNPDMEESQALHFEAIGEGETELVMIYQRSFEDQGADQQAFRVYVTVN